ncbi:ATP-grasp domain-containing protein [Nocardia sp. NBC_01499]|uniref:ATP-grasp domain-containing protein n=1 Tax=Nocardia sp. NBC_01499 TaxID=2903597 RepID=UPI00386A67B1
MKIAVIDGFSTGRLLVSELRRRGVDCVHVQTSRDIPEYFLRGFRPSDYSDRLDGEIDPTILAHRLAELRVDRVVAGAESGVILADTLTHLMGLPGNRHETLAARRNKQLMAETAAAAGIAVPRGRTFGNADDARAWFISNGLTEAVVKPLSSAVTDNVRFCCSADDVHHACKAVLSSNNVFGQPNTAVLVQERVHGVEYYANTVSYDGVHRVAELWRYSKRAGSTGSPVYDYEEPVPVHAEETAPLRSFVVAVLDALGVVCGAAHTEVMMTERGPVLIETGARLGGGTAPDVVQRYSGISQTSLLADMLTVSDGLLDFDDDAVTWSGRLRNVALINMAAGHVRSLDWAERLRALPTLVHLTCGVGPGSYLPETIDLASSPGYVYLTSEDSCDVQRDYEVLRAMETEGLYTAYTA